MGGLYIQDCVIEITRRCNLRCEHCLRGEAENKDMNPIHLMRFADQVSRIGMLTITGGEPSLNVEGMTALRTILSDSRVEVENFYIVTNAQEFNKEFYLEIMEWYLFCTDNEMSGVSISNDVFHEDPDDKQVALLQVLKFTDFRETSEHNHYARKSKLNWDNLDIVIAEGRGREIGGKRELDAETVWVWYRQDCEEHSITDGVVYVNCKGEILTGCDWSYESQSKHVVCKVTDDIALKFVDKFGVEEQ